MTFETYPAPQFAAFSAHGYAPPVRERLLAALRSEAALVPMRRSEHLAYTLYGSAFFVEVSAEARFIMLMMAFESLMKQERRTPEARARVDGFVHEIQTVDDLSVEEQQALVAALQLLKRESLSQAGRRLAATLDDRTYADMSAREFFTVVYGLRGRLVHPSGAGVNVVEVEALIGPLQDFVGDLLAGPGLRAETVGRP
ncbi:hypothetical protein [Nocardioides sp. Soil777]|uniref:hypothetical protein n=1 Tax=Nocardioides sp. Soil777 TaxID=1736409 RepID=UPI0012F82FDA|nr:hypothetical protein [Nocardioides sp. Soil777]